MKLAFHQPNFLPNLGFFHKMAESDIFVIVTNINFEKREGWQRRHKIPGRDKDIWLTVPVAGSQNTLIKDVMISDHGRWQLKHRKTLQLNYARTAEQHLLTKLDKMYEERWERLVDLNMSLILLIKEALGITTPVVLDEEVGGAKERLIINICQKYDADIYLSGLGGKDYMTDLYYQSFAQAGIEAAFVPRNVTNLHPYSSIHYLLSQGRKETAALI